MTEYSTIANEVDRINTNIENTYTALQAKGATLPTNRNANNLENCAKSIINYPLIPSAMNGLCFWLDGDCNTRQGLDRSKKYMENLVWNPPYSYLTIKEDGNCEYHNTSNGTNYWDNNILFLNDFSLYPRIFDLQMTFEFVVNSTRGGNNIGFWMNNSTYIGQYEDSKSQGYCVYPAINGLGYWYRSGNQDPSGWIQFKDLSWIANRYTVMTVNWDYDTNNEVAIKLYNPADSQSKEFKHNISIIPPESTLQFQLGGSTPNYSKRALNTNNAFEGYGIGMLRVWSRILTVNEITANYLDAKRRFNCK